MRGAARAEEGSAVEPGGENERQQTSPRGELVSSGTEGDALIQEVTASATTFRRVLKHSALFPGRGKTLAVTVDKVEERLARRDLSVVVVGEKGAGKTTFLDALIGIRDIGVARGPSLVTTLLKRGPSARYRAQFKDGKVEDFARRVPDYSEQFEKALTEASAQLLETEKACAAAAHRVRDTQKKKARAESELKRMFAEFERLRDVANDAGKRLFEAEQETERAHTSLAIVTRSLPAPLRTEPAWWEFWLWFWRALLLLVKRSDWQRYSLERNDSRQKQARKLALERETTEAADACNKAESALDPAAADVETLRAEITVARKEFPELKREREMHRKEVERANGELSRHREERLARFYSEIKQLADTNGRGRDVVELTVEYPARFLPDDVTIIDAPAVTSGVAEQEERAFNVIRERADGCILLTELDRGVGGGTARFLQRLKDVVPHVLLVLTKMDRAYVEARERAKGEAWEQVEKARRIGTRRFAREIGRSPDTVLSISVAAQAALDDENSGLARRFGEEIQKLFQLLRHERAVILGMRSANAVRGLIAEMAEAKPRVARSYEDRIAGLEAKRAPEPDAFRAEALATAEGEIAVAAVRATEAASRAARDAFSIIRSECMTYLTRAAKPADLVTAAARSEKAIEAGILNAKAGAQSELETQIDRAVREIEVGIFDQLRNRYQLIHEVRRSSSSLVEAELAIEPATHPVSLAPFVQATVESNRRARIGLGAGGAVGLGVIGFFVGGPIGALVGVLLGPLLALARTRAALIQRAVAQLDRTLARESSTLDEELSARRPGLEGAIRSALDNSLERAITRFGRWIAEPIEAERRAIETERRNLTELGDLAGTLEAHDARLGELMKAALEASLGLCR